MAVRTGSGRGALLGFALAGLGLTPACLVTTKQHDLVKAQVDDLESRLSSQEAELDKELEAAQTLVDELQGKLAEAEGLLRRNQADLGLRVENLELETQQLRGEAENAAYVASANRQEQQELRSDLDARIQTLEEKLNEATSIPDNARDLLAEAERQSKAKNHKGARRLYHIYQSRYPNDPQIPEVRFKIGLTYFSERDYKSSLGEFYRVIQDSPKAEVVPDALYYSGLSFAKLGQCENAIAYFKALVKKGSKAPERYKKAATEQVEILGKDKGELCLDRRPASPGDAVPRPNDS